MDIENKVSKLEKEIAEIKARNKKVEKSKARETSLFRKILILLLTYLIMSVFMYYIGVSNFWVNAIVPTLGFFLSTLSLPYFQIFWERYFYKK